MRTREVRWGVGVGGVGCRQRGGRPRRLYEDEVTRGSVGRGGGGGGGGVLAGVVVPGPSSEAICQTSIEGAVGREAAIASLYSTALAATLSARSSPPAPMRGKRSTHSGSGCTPSSTESA